MRLNSTITKLGFFGAAALLLMPAAPSQSAPTMTSANYEVSRPTLSSGGASGDSISTGTVGTTLGETTAIGFSAEFVNGNSDHAGFWPATRIDSDQDGILDENDNCRFSSNPLQVNTDTDSFGDVCDNCPIVDNETQLDSNFDGWGDACSHPGDWNRNGVVNDGDWTIWADHYLETGVGWDEGDGSGDGIVNDGDWTIWADHYLHTGPPH